MKILKNLMLVLFCFPLLLLGQENSLLWKISGHGLPHDSYIYGTIHIMCSENFSVDKKIDSAIQDVDAVYVEIDISKPEIMAEMQSKMGPDTAFLKNYSSTEIHAIDSALRSYGLSIQYLDMVSPFALSSLISLKAFECANPTDIKSYEEYILSAAKQQGKEIGDFETLEFQVKVLTDYTTPKSFYETVMNLDKMPDLVQQLVSAYKSEDFEKLEQFLTDPLWVSEEQFKLLITDRNTEWMKRIPSIIAEKKTLIAVGAGHIVGQHGLIQLLKQQGYQVTPVF